LSPPLTFKGIAVPMGSGMWEKSTGFKKKRSKLGD